MQFFDWKKRQNSWTEIILFFHVSGHSEAGHHEDQAQRKRKKRKVFKIIDEYQRVQILNYVRGNLDALFPEDKGSGRPKTANILAWDEVFQLCMRYK